MDDVLRVTDVRPGVSREIQNGEIDGLYEWISIVGATHWGLRVFLGKRR